MKELKNFISTCRNTQVVKNNGKSVVVSCGHCPDCIAKRSAKYRDLLIKEMDSNKYNHFVTLSYDDIFVPKALIVRELNILGDKIIRYVDVTNRPKVGKFRSTLPTYGKTIGVFSDDNNELFQEFLEQSKPLRKKGKKTSNDFIRWSSVVDVQRFIKRLRLLIAEKHDEVIRYFAVTEYGPKTFRPHVHIVLSHNSEQLNRYMQKYISASWKYGDIDFQRPRAQGSVSNYVAGYLNSDFVLPYFLSFDHVRPRTLHSRNFGNSHIKDIRDLVYENNTYNFAPFDVTFGQSSATYCLSALSHTLFPRCYNYDQKNNNALLESYTIFEKFKTISDKPSEITRYILAHYDNPFIYQYLRYQLNIILSFHVRDIPNPDLRGTIRGQLYYIPQTYLSFRVADLDWYQLMIYNRIYTNILQSKHFLTFCCEHVTPVVMLSKIKSYYHQLAQYRLGEFYYFLDKYNFLFNPYASDFSDDLEDDYYYRSLYFSDIFFHNIPNYDEVYKNNTYIQSINIQKDDNYKNKIKHKEISSLNIKYLNLLKN